MHDLIYLRHLAWMVPFGPDPITLATVPPNLLIFVITLAMGALGSVLYMTQYCLRFVIDRKSTTDWPLVRAPSWYVFRPMLGVMTALVVFIFVKAGQFSFSDASISTELNPYLISFLAIISGFLSWQALAAIQRAGYRFFRWQSKKDRWAYGVKKQIAVKKKTEDELAKKLEVSTEQLKKWLDEKEQVNHRVQAKIAEFLDCHPRELFTDIAEDGLVKSP